MTKASLDRLTSDDRRVFSGRRLLVTGAAGALGSELARRLAACGPARLTIFDHSDRALFALEAQLRERCPALDIVAVLGDVSRRGEVDAACRTGRPDVVYHAAAYQHAAIERSVVAAVRTNVLGALETAEAAREAGARFVLISSDTAAAPAGVTGATTRLAEVAVLGLATATFRPLAVRIGAVPAEEAAALVLQADLAGGRGMIFWRNADAALQAARPRYVRRDDVAASLRALRRAVTRGDASETLAELQAAVEGFAPSAAAWTAVRAA
jgi:nucleoside-diphosphate-sugar epimerase